jgi:hypothetical protein
MWRYGFLAGIIERIKAALRNHFTWDYRKDIFYELFTFKAGKQLIEKLNLEGVIFDKEEGDAREPFPHGGSAGRNFRKEWFQNGLNTSRAMFVKLTSCSHREPGAFAIIVFPEQNQKGE